MGRRKKYKRIDGTLEKRGNDAYDESGDSKQEREIELTIQRGRE